MAKITIEDNGNTHVFEGTITNLEQTTDTFFAPTIFATGARHRRTGTGTVELTMKFNNGPVDDA